MIEQTDLMKLLESYKIDYKKVMTDKVLDKGEYFGIKHVLEYLVNELKIYPKNIEKCPSILYLNVNEVRKNYEFLKQQKINISDVETCLHVLSTDNKDLKETYYYVLENYGLMTINRITSILRCNKDRIINIEKYGLSKDVTISASVSRRTIYEIEKIIRICKKYNIEITGSVFKQNAEEIEKIVEVCKKYNIEITGTVFLKSAEEIEKIVEICKKYNIEIKGNVFRQSAEEIEKIIEVCKKYNIEITGSVFMKNAEEIENIVEICKKYSIEITGSVFKQSTDEIEKIVEICKKYNIEITGSVFLKSAGEIEKIVEVCKRYNIEITGTVFMKNAEEIEKIIEVCKRYNIEIAGSVFMKSAEEIEKIIEVCKKYNIEITGTVFLKSAEEIEKIIEVCKKYNIEITGTVFLKKSSRLQKTIDFIIENYDERYLTPLIIIKEPKHLSEVMPYLDSLGVLEFIINSASISTLTKEEIKKRVEIIKLLGEDIVKNGKFNSVFGMNKTRLNKKLNSYKDNDVIYPLIEEYIVR